MPCEFVVYGLVTRYGPQSVARLNFAGCDSRNKMPVEFQERSVVNVRNTFAGRTVGACTVPRLTASSENFRELTKHGWKRFVKEKKRKKKQKERRMNGGRKKGRKEREKREL